MASAMAMERVCHEAFHLRWTRSLSCSSKGPEEEITNRVSSKGSITSLMQDQRQTPEHMSSDQDQWLVSKIPAHRFCVQICVIISRESVNILPWESVKRAKIVISGTHLRGTSPTFFMDITKQIHVPTKLSCPKWCRQRWWPMSSAVSFKFARILSRKEDRKDVEKVKVMEWNSHRERNHTQCHSCSWPKSCLHKSFSKWINLSFKSNFFDWLFWSRPYHWTACMWLVIRKYPS